MPFTNTKVQQDISVKENTPSAINNKREQFVQLKKDSKITDYYNSGPSESIKKANGNNFYKLDPYKTYKKKNIAIMVKDEFVLFK